MHPLDKAIDKVLALVRKTTIDNGACYNCGFVIRPDRQVVCVMPKPEDSIEDFADALAVAAQTFNADALVAAQQTRVKLFADVPASDLPSGMESLADKAIDALTFWIDKGAGTRIVTQRIMRAGDTVELSPPVDLGTEAGSTGMFANLMHGGYASTQGE